MEKGYSFKGFSSFMETFYDDISCRKFLEYLLWEGKPTCPYCDYNEKIYAFKNHKTFKCAECKRNFTVTVGTIFHSTNIPIRKWFIAMYLISANKTGISSHQIAKHIEITQANAWRMLHKIRKVMTCSEHFKGMLEGVIEADETYVGGKNKNRHWDKKFKYSQGRSTVDKTPVFGILQRGGKVIVWTLDSLNGRNMRKLILLNVKRGSIICTDEYKVYKGLDKFFEHGVIDHGKKQYKNGNYHTNNIEGFWNFIKREIMGTYRSVDKSYLNRYAREAAYRYNTRKMSDAERFVSLLKESLNVKITRKNI